ncbi:AbrB/MazE/SpoVT family DNA-binding domain-containing protein [Thermoproteota archaeon]
MKRKLVKQGRNALTVTIPAQWTKKYSLNPGDEVEVEETDRNIQISTEKEIKKGKTKIDISGLDPYLVWNLFNVAYRKGYDEIELFFENSKVLDRKKNKEVETIDHIKRIVNRIIGMDILRYGKNYCMIKEISKASADEFDNIMNRLFLSLINMGTDLLEAVKKDDNESLKIISTHTEENMNKLTDYCFRILNKIGYHDETSTIFMYQTVSLIENAADCYADIARKHSKDQKIVSLTEKSIELIKMVYSMFSKKDSKNISEIHKLKLEMKKECLKIMNTNDADITLTASALYRLSDDVMDIGYNITALF